MIEKRAMPHLKTLIDGCLEQEVQGRCSTFTFIHAHAPCGILYGKSGLCLLFLKALYILPLPFRSLLSLITEQEKRQLSY